MKHYLYRHIRPDTNEVFYVGIGTKQDDHDDTFENEYARAFKRHSRNSYWHNVYEKCGRKREVEIMLESDDYDWLEDKEREFVKLYGRADLGLGTLVNLTDGGDGKRGCKQTEEAKRRISEANKGRPLSEEHKEKIRKSLTGKKRTNKNREAISRGARNRKTTRSVLQYSLDGNFIQEWNSVLEAAEQMGFEKSRSKVYRCANGFQTNAAGFIWKWKTNEN